MKAAWQAGSIEHSKLLFLLHRGFPLAASSVRTLPEGGSSMNPLAAQFGISCVKDEIFHAKKFNSNTSVFTVFKIQEHKIPSFPVFLPSIDYRRKAAQ